MKKIIFFMFLFMLIGCNKEGSINNGGINYDTINKYRLLFRNDEFSIRDVNFLINQFKYYNYDSITDKDIIKIEVKLINVNGIPKMLSPLVTERRIIENGQEKSLFFYNGGGLVSGIGFKHGYIFDGDKCFVHCMYRDNGDYVVPWHCCIDPGDCVGFDPICCGEDEGWALMTLIYKTVKKDV